MRFYYITCVVGKKKKLNASCWLTALTKAYGFQKAKSESTSAIPTGAFPLDFQEASS